MKLGEQEAFESARFKVVCDRCGSLSIKMPALSECANGMIKCGKCGGERGTLAELQHLARRGTANFEF